MAKKVELAYPIKNERAFKAWRLMYPNAAKLLNEILFRWRACTIQVKGKLGTWSVYPISKWCEWTGLSRRQVERELRRLVTDGLIERERHHFEGNIVRAFIRPTAIAFLYLGRPKEKASAKAVLGGIGGGTYGGIGGGTDLTALPFHSNSSTSLQKAPASLCEEGKGKAHTKESTSKKLAEPAVVNTHKDDPDLAGGDVELLAKLKVIKTSHKMDREAKRAALLKLLPPIPGAAVAKVKHPADMHPKVWHGWSPELHVKRYERYCEYANNALNKSVGEKHMFSTSSTGLKFLARYDPAHDAEMAKLDAELATSMAQLDCVGGSSVLD